MNNMKKMNLIEIKNYKSKMNSVEWEDIHFIIKMMNEENIEIKEWYLIEIPCERTYFFYNFENRKSFDFEIDSDEKLKPHYYQLFEDSKITKHPAETIKEAIQNYKI